MAVEIKAPIPSSAKDVLTPEALAFIADLHRRFDPERRRRLEARAARQQRLDAGEAPDFLASTQEIREADRHEAVVWGMDLTPVAHGELEPAELVRRQLHAFENDVRARLERYAR